MPSQYRPVSLWVQSHNPWSPKCFNVVLFLGKSKYLPKVYLPIRSKILGIVSAAVGVVIAASFGLYSFAGFSPQATNNIPLPNSPLTPGSENVDSSSSPDNLNVDRTAVNRLVVEEGLDEDTATIISQINTQLKTYNNTYLNYEQIFSDEAWDVQTEAIPDQTYIPTDAELQAAASTGRQIYDVSSSFEEIDGIPQFTLRYFVPYEAMSEDLKASLQSSSPESSASAAVVGLLPAADGSEGASGAVIVTIIKNLIREGAGSKFGSLFGALDAAIGAYKLKESRSYFSELDQLRECAENPTNPLTKKTYQENPSEKAKVIDQINEAQSQLDQLTAARLLNLSVKTGSKFLTQGNFAGKLFLDSVAKWNDETLKQVSEGWVDDARKAVVKCEPAATQLNGSIQYRVSRSYEGCGQPSECWQVKEEASGSGTFFLTTQGSLIIVNGTGTYEQTRTKIMTKIPSDPLTEYNGEYNFVMSGDVPIVSTAGRITEFQLADFNIIGAASLVEDGSSTNYVLNYGDSKAKPVTEEIHRESNGGFACYFEGVDLVNGGEFKQDIGSGDTGVGSCEIELFPGSTTHG